MSFKRIVPLLLICLGFSTRAFAWQLKGVIRDAEGETLPYARVYVLNSTYGVVSNLKGEYFLELANGTYQLVFSSLGYKSDTLEVVIKNAPKVMDVVLEPEEVLVNPIIIVADRRDPAYEIIEKMVDNKHRYLKQFDSFKCETYLKVILEADSLPPKKNEKDSLASAADSLPSSDSVQVDSSQKKKKQVTDVAPPPGSRGKRGKEAVEKIPGREKLNFMEQVTETWYAAPRQYKEVVLALRDYTDRSSAGGPAIYVSVEGGDFEDGPPVGSPQSSNPYLFIPTVSQVDFNFYRNTVDFPALGQQPFISPISSTGKLYYKYHLEESFIENGMVIHKIQVIPRKWEGPMFEGHIFVVADLWCIKSVNLTLNPGVMNFYNYFQIIHDYERIDTNWVLKREEYFYNLNEGKRKFYGNTLALHKEYELNKEIPPRFFANELKRTEKEALERDSTWWAESRPVMLTAEEIDFALTQDSLTEVWLNADSLRKNDSIYNRITIWDITLNGVGFYNRAKGRSVYINSLLSSAQFFSPGGYRHSFGGNYTKEFRKGYVLGVTGNINYGFVNQDLRGEGQVSYMYNPRHFGKAYVGYGNVFSLLNPFESFTSFLSRGNYVNKIHYSVGHEYEIFNGIYADVEVRRFEVRSLADFTTDPLIDSLPNSPPAFEDYEESLINLKLSYTPFQKYITEPYKKVIIGSKWPRFTLKYTKSVPNVLGSDLDFDRLELGMNHNVQVGNFGDSHLNVYAGMFVRSDSLNITDYKYFRGSDPFLFSDPLKSFQLLGISTSTTKPYLAAHYYHNFYSLLFNKVPLLNKLKIQVLGGANGLTVPDQGLWHAEVWGGMQIPFRIKKQLFAIGTYYVASLSTVNYFDNQIKIGFNFFDTYRNKWSY